MKCFISLLLALAICAALAACQKQAASPEETTGATEPTAAVSSDCRATATDAEITSGDTTPTGRVYHTDERVFSVTYKLDQIVDFALLENAVSVTADMRGTGTANRKLSLDENAVAELLQLLRSFRVTPVAASDTSADKPEQAAYFEWTEEDGTVHRFSALKTEIACYLAFTWELLTGEELDDPALLFRIDEGEQTDGIFCFR